MNGITSFEGTEKIENPIFTNVWCAVKTIVNAFYFIEWVPGGKLYKQCWNARIFRRHDFRFATVDSHEKGKKAFDSREFVKISHNLKKGFSGQTYEGSQQCIL